MLSREDNERLVRVGPGQPAGEMFRRYWQPALLSEELPEKDCAPVRVRLLAEDLIAFRDTTGRVGLVDAHCPHRRAPLFFARNEECGLRCVYHGWKFDAEGTCVDMPSEPAESTFKSKIKLKAYPTVERGGLVWAYLGPKDKMPSPPDFEWTRAPATHRDLTKTLESCNYLQGMEGGLDTYHNSFLHYDSLGNKNLLRQKDRAPRIEIEPTAYGYYYGSVRTVDNSRHYVRVAHFIFPNHQMRANITSFVGDQRQKVPMLEGHIWVPIDDEHTWVYNWACGYDASAELTPEFNESWNERNGRGKKDMIPGTYELKQNKGNDYLIDRQVQKTRNYTGINGINTQDWAMQEGMGPVSDRTQEHLGPSDKAIITLRRMLLENTRVVERNEPVPSADAAIYRNIRPYDGFCPSGENWRTAFATEMIAKW
jgi:phenylpropionate dioxygenase-like ring-hydroxylating dioxygenase large terminal subunit